MVLDSVKKYLNFFSDVFKKGSGKIHSNFSSTFPKKFFFLSVCALLYSGIPEENDVFPKTFQKVLERNLISLTLQQKELKKIL